MIRLVRFVPRICKIMCDDISERPKKTVRESIARRAAYKIE